MTRKRFILALLLLLLLSALAVVGGHYYFRRPAINQEAFNKLKERMTQRDVEAILGTPAERYGQDITQPGIPPPQLHQYWRGTGESEGSIYVLFIPDERREHWILIGKWYALRHDPSLVEKIKEWLGVETPSVANPATYEP